MNFFPVVEEMKKENELFIGPKLRKKKQFWTSPFLTDQAEKNS